MRRLIIQTCRHTGILLGILFFISTTATAIQPITVELRPYGFPSGANFDDVFYVSTDRVALYFDLDANATHAIPLISHRFAILVISRYGQVLAQKTVNGFPKALDIKPGPDGGLVVAQEGSISFYDRDLQLQRSMPLPRNVIGVSFERRWNQLSIAAVDRAAHTQQINLLDGKSWNILRSYTVPERAHFKSGNGEIVFSAGGLCERSTHVLSKERSWNALDGLPICGFLAFVGSDALAYTADNYLHVVGRTGKELTRRQSVPVESSPSFPSFAGISDDNSRIAVFGTKTKMFGKRDKFAEYGRVFVFDLPSHKRIVSHAFPAESWEWRSALSPDGKQLATIDDGSLVLTPVP